MRSFVCVSCLLALAANSLAYAQLTFKVGDVGEIYQSNTGKTVITFENDTDKLIRILKVAAAYDRDKVGDYTAEVAPRTSIYIPIEVFSGMDAGDRQHIFRIETDYSKFPANALAHLFGLSVLDDPEPKIDLGVVDTSKTPQALNVELSSREVANFSIEKVIETPDFATAEILGDGRTVAVTGNPKADWGRHQGYVKLKLNSTIQPEAWVLVTADVHGDVIPSQNPIDLGVLRDKDDPTLVQFKSRDGRPVKLGKVSAEGFKASVTKESCVGGYKGCAQISLRLAPDQLGGRIAGKLTVELPDYKRVLPIDVAGLYLSSDVKIRSLDEELSKREQNVAGDATAEKSVGARQLPIGDALRKAVEPGSSAPAVPAGKGPILRWQVSNEATAYGYLVFRSDSASGPFLRINKDIVRTSEEGGNGVITSYAWRDESAESGKTYWYYVGLINRDGSKKALSEPQKVVAK